MSAYPIIKLTYFAFTGRAEAARLAFYIGNVPFIDERLTQDEFEARKSEFPLGQLPILTIDGEVLTQSEAILRYAGRLSGLYPMNAPLAALKINEVISGLNELGDAIRPSLRETDPKKIKSLREELADTTIPRYAKLIEARLEAMQSSPFFQSNDLFIHELVLFMWVNFILSGSLDHIPVTVFDGYKRINDTVRKVSENARVKEWYSIQHTTPKLKLTYFPLPGRAEPIRLALFIGGVPFEDERISFAEFQKRKPSLPFNQLVVLDVDGDVISQSLAILRYAGALTNLYPTNDPLTALRIDEQLALIDELYNSSWRSAFREGDTPEGRQMRKELAEATIPNCLESLENRVSHCRGPYAVETRLTVADLAIYGLVSVLKSGRLLDIPTTITTSYKRVEQVFNQVLSHPKVIEWNSAHPLSVALGK